MDIRQIPRVMRERMHWDKAPQLMDRWFGLPANSVPESGDTDRTIITMEWALGFPRARRVFDSIVCGQLWFDRISQSRIGNWLASQSLLTTQRHTFGIPNYSTATAQKLNNDTIVTRPVGSITDALTGSVDDMFGALGRFDFNVLVRGSVEPVTMPGAPPSMRGRSILRSSPPLLRYRVCIEEVGICLADSYDFNGDQPLGFWDESGVSRIGFPSNYVSNADFRAWRDRQGNTGGGDFLICSDVRTIRRSPADTFLV